MHFAIIYSPSKRIIDPLAMHSDALLWDSRNKSVCIRRISGLGNTVCTNLHFTTSSCIFMYVFFVSLLRLVFSFGRIVLARA